MTASESPAHAGAHAPHAVPWRLSDERMQAIAARCDAARQVPGPPAPATRDLMDLLREVRRLQPRGADCDPGAPPDPTAPRSRFVTTASETQCSALARYGVDARRQTPPHQMSAILSVGGIPVHGVTADVLLGLQIECVTDRGGSRELLISDAFTTDDLEALIAVLTAVRDRAHREGLLASDPGVPACVREDA